MGSWFSNPIEPKITQPNVLDRVNCVEHAWESEFGWENAVVYRALDTRPGICSICYNVSKHSDKVIYTFYDTFCDHNIVSVNIEFEAVRDGGGSHGGPYKFGLIKTKDFSEDFIQRRRRAHGPELLTLSYVTGRRRNQVALVKHGDGSYEIVFDSKSPLVVLHKSVHIYCDPSKGLLAYATTTGNRISHDNNSLNELPRDVLKAVYDIRRSFVMENATIDHFNDGIVPVLPSLPLSNRGNYNENSKVEQERESKGEAPDSETLGEQPGDGGQTREDVEHLSKLIEHDIARVKALDLVSCDEYIWRSEFCSGDGNDWALVFSALDTKPGTCASHFRFDGYKMIYTFYDAFSHENFVAVSIEFASERDRAAGDGRYRLDPIKVRDFGEKFRERRRRSAGDEVLFLSYVTGRRRNQLDMNREGEKYVIEFNSKSPLLLLHYRLSISCDPSNGKLTIISTNPIINGPSLVEVKFHGFKVPPPHHVMKDINNIRRQLTEDDNTGSSQNIYNSGNLVYNERNFGGGNIYQPNDSNQPRRGLQTND